MSLTQCERSAFLAKMKAEFIEPMECALVPKLPDGPDWTYEVKLDGYRAIGVKTSREAILYSRNHKNFNKRFPQIAEAIRELPADTATRDGSPERCCSASCFCDYFFCCAAGACSVVGGTMFLSRM